MAEALRKHEAECERIRRENARVAQLRTHEVEEKMFKEEQYKLVRNSGMSGTHPMCLPSVYPFVGLRRTQYDLAVLCPYDPRTPAA